MLSYFYNFSWWCSLLRELNVIFSALREIFTHFWLALKNVDGMIFSMEDPGFAVFRGLGFSSPLIHARSRHLGVGFKYSSSSRSCPMGEERSPLIDWYAKEALTTHPRPTPILSSLGAKRELSQLELLSALPRKTANLGSFHGRIPQNFNPSNFKPSQSPIEVGRIQASDKQGI